MTREHSNDASFTDYSRWLCMKDGAFRVVKIVDGGLSESRSLQIRRVRWGEHDVRY